MILEHGSAALNRPDNNAKLITHSSLFISVLLTPMALIICDCKHVDETTKKSHNNTHMFLCVKGRTLQKNS